MRQTGAKQYGVRWLALAPVVGLIMTGFGCGTPQPPTALEQARAAYTQAQQNPQVASQAPVALREAEQAVQRAEQTWNKDHDVQETEHLAYVAQQRVERARALAEKNAAEVTIKQAETERERILREARLREAQRAQQQAQAATARAQQLQQQLAAVQAKVSETDRGLVLTLGDVLFGFNRATLNPGAMRNLYPLVTYLKENPERAVTIEGYTDSVGSESYNQELSQQRAEAVRGFLIDNGVNANRIVARGYGEENPIASNNTELGRQQNRRVEVVIAQQQ